MFNFIRSMFAKSVVASNFNPHPGDVAPSIRDHYMHKFPKFPSIDCPYLSQSELQMLQRLVAEKISNLESDIAFCKHDASVYGKGSEERDFLFKEASKKQSKINKLSTLQYRLKHKIAAKS